MRAPRVAVLAAALCAALALALPSATGVAATSAHRAVTTTVAPAARLRVGSLTLTRCAVVPGAWCGSVRRLWDPANPAEGSLSVGFAFRPASDRSQPALGTLAPHEGGPGYSTTGTAPDYAAMYGGLLRRRNLLLVDQRGTGLSAPVGCPTLQHLVGPYAPAAAVCAAKLGSHFDLYGSALSADDLSAVISALGVGPVDLYGDSYGTFFAQVFLGRHPAQLRSVVLDSAYPTYGENAWYATQGPAMRTSFEKVCARTPSCAALGGSTLERLTPLLDVVRRTPLRAKATGADGRTHLAVIDASTLAFVAFNATFGAATYRELDPAVRAALAGDPAPIARLVAEDEFAGPDGPAEAYSEGLDAAVSCQDYPQLYDMAAPPSVRAGQFAAAVAGEQSSDPQVYGPFSIAEYLASDWEEQDWCLEWPVADPAHAAGPPMPPGGHYAAVPTLVLSGELDSITTPAEGALVVGQIPGARQVIVANSFHVTATDDTDGCGQALVRSFVADPTAPLPAAELHCAATVPPVRGSPSYAASYRDEGPGPAGTRAARTALLTVADTMDRWLQSIAGTGTGLRGGTWTSGGYDSVTLRLNGVRLTDDLAVSGTVRWDRYGHQVSADLRLVQVDRAGIPVPGSTVTGHLTATWDSRAAGARATVAGTLGGHRVWLSLLAP